VISLIKILIFGIVEGIHEVYKRRYWTG